MTLVDALTRTAPYGDEATWDSRRRWPLVHRRMPTAPDGTDELPNEVRELLTACVSLDPAARPRLGEVRSALEPLRSPAPSVHDVVAPLPPGR
jgi:hypothetical protein